MGRGPEGHGLRAIADEITRQRSKGQDAAFRHGRKWKPGRRGGVKRDVEQRDTAA